MVTSKHTPKARKSRPLSPSNDYTAPGPVKRRKRIYSKFQKKQVLLFLCYHRIPKDLSYSESRPGLAQRNPTKVLSGFENPQEDGFRRPTAAEAAAYFKINNTNVIYDWWKNKEKILGGAMPKAMPPKWPRLEEELLKRFKAARDSNKIVIIHWFRRMAPQFWLQLYPYLPEFFVFSNGWF
jgi:hypothetical protein